MIYPLGPTQWYALPEVHSPTVTSNGTPRCPASIDSNLQSTEPFESQRLVPEIVSMVSADDWSRNSVVAPIGTKSNSPVAAMSPNQIYGLTLNITEWATEPSGKHSHNTSSLKARWVTSSSYQAVSGAVTGSCSLGVVAAILKRSSFPTNREKRLFGNLKAGTSS